ncbi:MAG: hypothetical protein NDJ24_00450 [Alphaproteobacteria bacterium]|nr:hypothetical protein [Alphaproteobacteria bacterium]
MKEPTEACLRSTFRNIADGGLVPNRFGTMVQSAIRLNLTDKQTVANILGVETAHVFGKANNLKSAEIRHLCKKLAL